MPGDVIREINRKPVTSMKDYDRVASDLKKGAEYAGFDQSPWRVTLSQRQGVMTLGRLLVSECLPVACPGLLRHEKRTEDCRRQHCGGPTGRLSKSDRILSHRSPSPRRTRRAWRLTVAIHDSIDLRRQPFVPPFEQTTRILRKSSSTSTSTSTQDSRDSCRRNGFLHGQQFIAPFVHHRTLDFPSSSTAGVSSSSEYRNTATRSNSVSSMNCLSSSNMARSLREIPR